MSIPKIGIIGGSGLYHMKSLTNVKEVRVKTPFGAPSDCFIAGKVSGREVVFLARHARGHRLLPGELNHRANIWALKKLGCAWLISVSAVGSLQAKFAPRTLVFPDQFFDRTKRRLNDTFFGEGIVAHLPFGDPTSVALQKILFAAAKKKKAKAFLGGTYVNMEGPQFSTKAESNFYRRQGFDIVGMTNLAEAKLAREAQIAYAPMSCVTDYDCWHPDHDHVTIDMVIGHLQANSGLAQEILAESISQWPTEPSDPAHTALTHAILTDRKLWPKKTAQKLAVVLRGW